MINILETETDFFLSINVCCLIEYRESVFVENSV